MEVLLLGEFSALHKYLKEGLEENGIKVKLIANGDSWKRIDGADNYLYRTDGNLIQKLYRKNIEPFNRFELFEGYDVVQFINTLCFHPTVNPLLISKMKERNGILSLVAAGYDTRLYEKYKSGFFEYYMMDDALDIQESFDKKRLKGRIHQWNDLNVEKQVDIIIPSAYEYQVGYLQSGKVSSVIPFPVNVSKIEYSENKVDGKVVFFHGLNREIEKGTPFIKEALMKLQANYPNDVEVIIDGHMPFKKYQEVIKRANVVVDQCKSYGYGINACISMALGKVVLSGCHKEHLASMDINECPIIEIRPSVDQIYSQLKQVLENRALITAYGKQSREYVERYHDNYLVAKRYIHIWEEAHNRKG